ncbi:YoaK family protein [Allofustis seminis]|uniref:YoaK family protein n=1 Tax=Allofustis seminis TaxID=166939 RepID=UPI00037EC6C1|nr:YoaK family protein [Allofustis seminis]
MDRRANLEIVYTYLLHALAGFLNALTIMAFGKMTGVMTGNMSSMIILGFAGEKHAALVLLFYVFCYFLGSMIVGFLSQFHISHQVRDLDFFGFHLLFAALFTLFWFLTDSIVLSISVVAVRLGMQNAFPLPSRHKRIRTTSMTGLLTEIGILMGGLLRGSHLVNIRSLTFNILYLLTFFLGTSISALIHYKTHFSVLLVGIVLELLAAAFCYRLSSIEQDE